MTFWKWSRTASSNATADSTCPFPEGMAPSAVNDGVRGLMAAAAKYRDDIGGGTNTVGSGSVYILTTNQGFVSPIADGAMLAFYATATNLQNAALNVDGIGAFPLTISYASPPVGIPAGVIVAGSVYRVRFASNGANSAWLLDGFYGQIYSVPIGGFMPFLSTTPPNSSFVLPFGQNINRLTYATLFSMIGTSFGAGDGSATFGIPDLRGRVIAAQDNMGGVAAGRITSTGSGVDGTALGATGGAQSKAFSTAEMPAHVHPNTLSDPGHSHSTNGLSGVISGGPRLLETTITLTPRGS